MEGKRGKISFLCTHGSCVLHSKSEQNGPFFNSFVFLNNENAANLCGVHIVDLLRSSVRINFGLGSF